MITYRIVSAVQAALSCAAGSVVCLWSCTRDFLHSSHFMSEAYAWFGAAYFFYDIWSMYKVHINMAPSSDKSSKNVMIKNIQNQSRKDSDTIESKKYVSSSSEFINEKDVDALFKDHQKMSGCLSFLSYCKDQPIIVIHHLFIGGFGFLVIVVRFNSHIFLYNTY